MKKIICEKKKVIKLNGFTLIELIIVIAIMAVIASIIIPKVLSVKDSASEGVDKHNIRMLQQELENYRAKEETYPIATSAPGLLSEFKNCSEGTIFLDKLPKYKSGKDIIMNYDCHNPGTTYSIAFNDDPATSINEGDSKYIMNQDTNTNDLFK